jgi:hypothetical protein
MLTDKKIKLIQEFQAKMNALQMSVQMGEVKDNSKAAAAYSAMLLGVHVEDVSAFSRRFPETPIGMDRVSNMRTTITLDGKERNAAWTALSILSNIEGHLRASVPPDSMFREYPAEWAAICDVTRAQRALDCELFPGKKC